MIITSTQIACEYKRWFRRKVIVYLKLNLYHDGTWDIAINTKYFSDKITKKLWRHIRKYCRVCITDGQTRVLKKVFKIGLKDRSASSKYDPITKMEASYKQCMEYIDTYQILGGE